MAEKTFKEQAYEALHNVIDPELGINLVDLGLIYDAKLTDEGEAQILMTLTIVGCPLTEWLADSIQEELKKVPGVKTISIEVTFDPAWTENMMSREARVELGIY
ncbi:metal-sulfur cluster assembly factor [Lactiplantibacillus modestisalitolerans]|uniref:Metal-sulfur cluster assembly factor n=1 Tax=Lactiplantibacillus modestisalitolerans TaxID=1457219 RepID=A0ABV5WSN8_9LACO|nr:metal-sulfur cluster assembly factor [Lactiplantibacillus modestisalitolerans]